MPKPLIGLTTSRIHHKNGLPTFRVNQSYTKSITVAGGSPINIPLDLSNNDLDALLARLDGILFTGGYDIDPQKYGSQPHPKAQHIDHRRDEIEIHLVQAIVEEGKPFLGICRGLQVINVALGGSLYEDLPEQFPGDIHHDNHDKPRNYLAHAVKLEKDSRLAHILKSNQAQVNSLHHQGVRKLASHLHPTALTSDGLIEAIELPETRFGLAVQWHPEELQEYEAMRRLFQVFVQSCQAVNSV